MIINGLKLKAEFGVNFFSVDELCVRSRNQGGNIINCFK